MSYLAVTIMPPLYQHYSSSYQHGKCRAAAAVGFDAAAVLEPICVLQCWSLSAGMDSPCSSVLARPVSDYTILRHIVEQFLIE